MPLDYLWNTENVIFSNAYTIDTRVVTSDNYETYTHDYCYYTNPLSMGSSTYLCAINTDATNSTIRYVKCSPYIWYDSNSYSYREESPIETKRREIQSNLTIIVKSRAQKLTDVPDNEWVAMQTLRDMITEAEYRRYIKYGFISVLGKSGKIYQVDRVKRHVKVFLKGVLVEEICVGLKGDAPPTDKVIAFKTMIEADEESFAALGNRYNMLERKSNGTLYVGNDQEAVLNAA